MSTNARIAIQLSDKPGYYVSVYHHWDGYPQWLGKTLGEQYNSRKLASELIDGGDMSSCWTDSIWGEQLSEGQYAPEYCSQRGEDCPPKFASTTEELFEQCDNCGARRPRLSRQYYNNNNRGWCRRIIHFEY